jgi:hypothetical protein
MVVNTCNLSYMGGGDKRSLSETSLGKKHQTLSEK